MLEWILLVLALWSAQVLLPAGLRLGGAGLKPAEQLKFALGPRDEALAISPLAARAERARVNLGESLPVFLTLGLVLYMQGQTGGMGVLGAGVFFVARALYLPAYLFVPTGARTALWTIAAAGLVMMAAAVLQSAGS